MTPQKVIKNLKKLKSFHNGSYGTAIDMAIKALKQPSVTDFSDKCKECGKILNDKLQTRWIPVSERLPEIHQDVLLSLRSLDVLEGFRAGTEPYYYCQGVYVVPQDVVAWMPLPEPYKVYGGKSEKDN